MNEEEIHEQFHIPDEHLSEQIFSYTNCRNSTSYKLSETTNGIVELLKVHSKFQNIKIQESLDELFKIYKSLGGTADVPEKVVLMDHPCKAIADDMKSNIEIEVALQKSAGNLKKMQSDTNFKSPVIDFMSCKKPDYPRIALWLKEQGTIRLAFFIGPYGIVNFSFIAKSSGVMLLDNAALEVLSKCPFTAGSFNGQARPSWLFVDYVFKLQD